MAFFIIPQKWIAPAIAAAAMSFGGIGQSAHIRYHNFPKVTHGAAAVPPNTIWMDKAKRWDKVQAQCLIVHEYGHLRGHKHTKRGIMQPTVPYAVCQRWLAKHGVK
jgi:hypothetical protein